MTGDYSSKLGYEHVDELEHKVVMRCYKSSAIQAVRSMQSKNCRSYGVYGSFTTAS